MIFVLLVLVVVRIFQLSFPKQQFEPSGTLYVFFYYVSCVLIKCIYIALDHMVLEGQNSKDI